MSMNLKNALEERFCVLTPINNIKEDLIPDFAKSEDFIKYFLPYLTIKGDSREKNLWIAKACDYYGINYEKAVKSKTSENLKEGDYSFNLFYGAVVFDYEGKVAYERKASSSELYNNLTCDRDRLKEEFARFKVKGYQKVVMLLEFADTLLDLVNMEFSYYENGRLTTKHTGNTLLQALLSWKQPNAYNFDIMMSKNHIQLFWLMVLDMYYFFRNEIRRKGND